MLPSSIDGVVERVSGSYQLLLLFLLLINLMHVCIHSSITEHHLTTPEHHCKLPQGWKEQEWLPTAAVSAIKPVAKNRDIENKQRKFAMKSDWQDTKTISWSSISPVNSEQHEKGGAREDDFISGGKKYRSKRVSRAAKWRATLKLQPLDTLNIPYKRSTLFPIAEKLTTHRERKRSYLITPPGKCFFSSHHPCITEENISVPLHLLALHTNGTGRYWVQVRPPPNQETLKKTSNKMVNKTDRRLNFNPGKSGVGDKTSYLQKERVLLRKIKLTQKPTNLFLDDERHHALRKCDSRGKEYWPSKSLSNHPASFPEQGKVSRLFMTEQKLLVRKPVYRKTTGNDLFPLPNMRTQAEKKYSYRKRDLEMRRSKRRAGFVVDDSPFVLLKGKTFIRNLPENEMNSNVFRDQQKGQFNRSHFFHGVYSFEIVPEEILSEEIDRFHNSSRIHRFDVPETKHISTKTSGSSEKTLFRDTFYRFENTSDSIVFQSLIKNETFEFSNLNTTLVKPDNEESNVWSTSHVQTPFTKGFITYSSCEMYVDSLDRRKGTKSCVYGYIFQLQDSEWSITAEWGLVCERAWLRPWLSTITHCGGAIGALSGGLLADRLGRHYVLVGAVWGAGVLGIVIHLVRRLILFVALRGLQELCLQAMWVVSWVLVCESLPHNLRLSGLLSCVAAAAVGAAAAAAAAHFLQSWRSVQLALSLPLVTSVVYVWVIPEPIRWLLASGESGRALVESHRTARYNRRKLPPSTEAHVSNLATAAARKGRSRPGSLALLLDKNGHSLDLFKDKNGYSLGTVFKGKNGYSLDVFKDKNGFYLDIVFKEKSSYSLDTVFKDKNDYFPRFFISLTTGMTYHAIMSSATHSNASELWLRPLDWTAHSGNKFHELLNRLHSRVWILRLSVVSALRLVAVLISGILLSVMRRKFVLITSQLLTTVLTVAMVAVRIFWTGSETLSSLVLCSMLLLDVLVSHCALCTLVVLSLDVLPTVARASGLGVLAAVAAIGQLVMPLLLLVGSLTYPFVPWVILSSGTFISSVLTLLLPDTTTTALPDFAEDSEMLGRKLTIFRLAMGRESGNIRCSIMSVIDVSRDNGNTSDSTECKSFRRYPLEQTRKSIKRKTSYGDRKSQHTKTSGVNRAPKSVKRNNDSESSEEIGPSRGVGRIDVLSKVNESKAVQTNFPRETSANQTIHDNYSHKSLCSIEMKHLKPSSSPTDFGRNDPHASTLCEACKESTSLEHNPKLTKRSALNTTNNSSKWKSQTRNDLSKISTPPPAICKVKETHESLPKIPKIRIKSPEVTPTTSRGNHALEQTSMVKENSILDTKPTSSKIDPNPGQKPKPRVSKDIFMRLQELKKAAKLTGECELFSEIHSRSSDCTVSSSKASSEMINKEPA
ncbi:Major facilitator superfamily [Trinorchestia longiramus]|nr:Major facilitator superfamily [Trinorchestia longiramus]